MTKKYKFYIADDSVSCRILRESNGYFDYYRSMPSEFTLSDVMNNDNFSDSQKKRIASLKPSSIFKLTKLCKWSSASGFGEYLVIKCLIPEHNTNVSDLKQKISQLETQSCEIQSEIDAKVGDLIKSKRKVDAALKKLKDKLSKIYIKN